MSFGTKVGKFIGAAGALAVEGAVRGATGLGEFGADVVAGAELGYTEKAAQLLITREAAKVKRDAALKAHAEKMLAAREPAAVPAPTTKRRAAA